MKGCYQILQLKAFAMMHLLTRLLGEMNAALPERFRGTDASRANSSYTPPSFDDLDLTLNLDIRHYVEKQSRITGREGRDAWLDQEELPANEEIFENQDQAVELAPNKVRGKWKSVDKYLKAHYALLREDAVSPLRDAVDTFRKTPDMSDGKGVCIYEKVHIAGFTFSQKGIAVRVTFSTARAGKRIIWGASKRLTSGSLVALTPARDKFTTTRVIAVVAARPLAGVESTPCEVDLFFARPQELEIDPQTEWLMIEAKTGYYEALRHTMRALQKLSTEPFKFKELICGLSLDIPAPEYLQDRKVDLSAALNDPEQKKAFESVEVIHHWPSLPTSTSLDKTQWTALQQILTKRLAIIQGPPGTGKTYVSKVALEILSQNRRPDDPPIIIAAQTNHALDQLLSHVSAFEPEYIRLGGRSTSLEVKQRALFEVRRRERVPVIPGGLFGPSNSTLRALTQDLINLLEPLHSVLKQQPLSAQTFLALNIVTKQQYDSLEQAAADWVSASTTPENSMSIWLNNALIPFKIKYQPDNFGFEDEDEDLEYEQLQELEAETGVNDVEDAEMLRGPWCQLADPWTCSPAAATTLDKAKRELDTRQNLNDIPNYLRPVVYSVLQEKAKIAIRLKVRETAEQYAKIARDLNVGKWERDYLFLKRANIIGLTTTGLSKYRPLIASLQPKIILIEEAAEVIEAPVTVANLESLEHLILVGDHQQLQGQCSVSDLENEPYYLNVSMFERLVGNSIPFKTLLHQRRMHPDFRQLLSPLYPELKDHEDIVRREPLEFGMGKHCSYFFDHQWYEDKDSQFSTLNDQEALFIAGVYKYLLKNKVTPQEITVLTFYNGQRKRILKYLRADPLTSDVYHNVKTVDSYQGEENEIVLLSLVRSNEYGRIGFLDIDNRVCVAISRAKRGFFLFGNAGLLQSQSELWHQVITIMEKQPPPDRVGMVFPITCRRHGKQTTIRYPDDWKHNDGGCDEQCNETLDCGHNCTLRCHPYDHETVKCNVKCTKQLPCGHICLNSCSDSCICECSVGMNGGKDGGNGGWPGGANGFSRPAPDPDEGKKQPMWSSSQYHGPATDGGWDRSEAPQPGSGSWSRGMEVQGNNTKTEPNAKKHTGRSRRGEDRKEHTLIRLPCRVPPQVEGAETEQYPASSTPPPPSWKSRPSTSSIHSAKWTFGSHGKSYNHHSYLPAETVHKSSQDWGYFSTAGVKYDDLRREQMLDDKADLTSPRVQVIEVEKTDSSGPSDRVSDMGGGRKKWIETFIPEGLVSRPREAHQEDLLHFDDGPPPRDPSPKEKPESVNLIEMD